MLVIVLCIVCIILLAAVIWQTMQLRALQQQMDEFCQQIEEDARKREAAWHDLVHDLRNPAAAVYALADLIQGSKDDPKQTEHFLEEIHKAADQVLAVLNKGVPPRRVPIANPRKQQSRGKN